MIPLDFYAYQVFQRSKLPGVWQAVFLTYDKYLNQLHFVALALTINLQKSHDTIY